MKSEPPVKRLALSVEDYARLRMAFVGASAKGVCQMRRVAALKRGEQVAWETQATIIEEEIMRVFDDSFSYHREENTMTTLLAFHGNPAIKATYLARVGAHEAADEIVHGIYWEHGKGCAVGCILHSSDHSAAVKEIGVPRWLMLLIDGIFEALPNGKSKTFPRRFLEAIPVGADVAPVRDQFLAWLMEDPKFGLALTAREQEIKNLAAEVGRRLRTGEGVTGPEAAALAARLRDAWAAWEARDAWAARAAWEARDAWDARTAWAARAARAAWDARRTAFVEASSSLLLECLVAAPVPHPTATA